MSDSVDMYIESDDPGVQVIARYIDNVLKGDVGGAVECVAVASRKNLISILGDEQSLQFSVEKGYVGFTHETHGYLKGGKAFWLTRVFNVSDEGVVAAFSSRNGIVDLRTYSLGFEAAGIPHGQIFYVGLENGEWRIVLAPASRVRSESGVDP